MRFRNHEKATVPLGRGISRGFRRLPDNFPATSEEQWGARPINFKGKNGENINGRAWMSTEVRTMLGVSACDKLTRLEITRDFSRKEEFSVKKRHMKDDRCERKKYRNAQSEV